jgi:hypothetical protein
MVSTAYGDRIASSTVRSLLVGLKRLLGTFETGELVLVLRS